MTNTPRLHIPTHTTYTLTDGYLPGKLVDSSTINEFWGFSEKKGDDSDDFISAINTQNKKPQTTVLHLSMHFCMQTRSYSMSSFVFCVIMYFCVTHNNILTWWDSRFRLRDIIWFYTR